MVNKIFIWIIGIIFLAPLVFAEAEDVLFNETFDSALNWSTVGCAINPGGSGRLEITATNQRCLFVHNISPTVDTEISIIIEGWNITTLGTNNWAWHLFNINNTGGNDRKLLVRGLGSTDQTLEVTGGTNIDFNLPISTSVPGAKTDINITLFFNRSVIISSDGVLEGQSEVDDLGQFFSFTSEGSSDTVEFIDSLHILNISIEDITAPVVTIEAPTPVNNSFSTTITQVFNLSIVEPNLDTITLNFNGTNETGFVNDFGNFHSLTKNTMAEGLFTYIIHVNDLNGNEFTSGEFQFTVDNTTPQITYTIPNPDNSTVADLSTGDIDINGFNINLDIGNLSVFNITDEIIFSNVTTGISGSTFTFTNSFDEIFTNQPSADYRFRACFIDSVNIESCQDVNITLSLPVPAVTAEAILPLENASNVVGMIALFLIVLTALGIGAVKSKK